MQRILLPSYYDETKEGNPAVVFKRSWTKSNGKCSSAQVMHRGFESWNRISLSQNEVKAAHHFSLRNFTIQSHMEIYHPWAQINVFLPVLWSLNPSVLLGNGIFRPSFSLSFIHNMILSFWGEGKTGICSVSLAYHLISKMSRPTMDSPH